MYDTNLLPWSIPKEDTYKMEFAVAAGIASLSLFSLVGVTALYLRTKAKSHATVNGDYQAV